MKKTLLEIVQDVHNDLDFDLVNSISDTTESVRVAQMAQSTFFEMINGRDWPHLLKLGTALSSVNVNQKTQLLLPELLSRVNWLMYNRRRIYDNRDKFEKLIYQDPMDFIITCNGIDNSLPNVVTSTTEDGATYLIRTDRPPTYWTSFNDQSIVLDSYDSSFESSIQGIHTQLSYYANPTWEVDDLFVPDLPDKLFPGYLAELKSVCAQKINEVSDAKAEQQSTRQRRRMSNQAWETYGGIQTPNYGRSPKGGSNGIARATFRQDR